MPGRTLVVDPLVALIEDQVESLARHGIDRTTGITSRHNSLADAADAYFVFVSPERLQRQPFRDELTERCRTHPVNIAVIDEAHCVSEWGHDFRSAYLNFGALLRRVCTNGSSPPPLLALTGTASRAVLTDVMFQLGINPTTDVDTVVRPVSFDRPELTYHVVPTTPTAAASALRDALHAMPALFNASRAAFYQPTNDHNTFSGIVFVPTVRHKQRGIDAVTKHVQQFSPKVARYSGRSPNKGISPSAWELAKARDAAAFKSDTAPVIVTTKAFGMGIDKPNVRWVIHYGLPASLEAYYQEAGRAGRDRRPAHCVLILTENDRSHNRSRLADTTAAASSSRSQQDDVDQALWFHRQAFPSPEQETGRMMTIYDQIVSGAAEIPLTNAANDERALHRLAVLGIIDDYTLEGFAASLKATILPSADTTPQNIVDNLLSFVQRSQPGRAPAIRNALRLPYTTPRDALSDCSHALLGLIHATIVRARLRSLREMWLVATDAANPADDACAIVRQRILAYLTEGDATPIVQELAERTQFAYTDWIPRWEKISTPDDAQQWRSAAARLLSSYPDHPGLLATRGIAEALLPDGSPAETDTNLQQSFTQAAGPYATSSDDITAAAEWMLATLATPAPTSDTPVTRLAPSGCLTSHDLAAAVITATTSTPAAALTQRWLADHKHLSATLAVLHLADKLNQTIPLTHAILDRRP